MPKKTYYAVVNIVSERIVYRGDAEGSAANWLMPGRTYGKGKTQEDATNAALDSALFFRCHGYKKTVVEAQASV